MIDREAPGLAEAMRAASREHTPMWMTSRGVAGTRGRSLIVNFPGNPPAIEQAGAAIEKAIPHAVALLGGRARAPASLSSNGERRGRSDADAVRVGRGRGGAAAPDRRLLRPRRARRAALAVLPRRGARGAPRPRHRLVGGGVRRARPATRDELGGYESMLAHHRDLGITPEARHRFASLFSLAADDAGLPDDPEFRSALVAYLEWGTRLALAQLPARRRRRARRRRCRAGAGARRRRTTPGAERAQRPLLVPLRHLRPAQRRALRADHPGARRLARAHRGGRRVDLRRRRAPDRGDRDGARARGSPATAPSTSRCRPASASGCRGSRRRCGAAERPRVSSGPRLPGSSLPLSQSSVWPFSAFDAARSSGTGRSPCCGRCGR